MEAGSIYRRPGFPANAPTYTYSNTPSSTQKMGRMISQATPKRSRCY